MKIFKEKTILISATWCGLALITMHWNRHGGYTHMIFPIHHVSWPNPMIVLQFNFYNQTHSQTATGYTHMTKLCPNIYNLPHHVTNTQQTFPSCQKPTYTLFSTCAIPEIHNCIATAQPFWNSSSHSQQHSNFFSNMCTEKVNPNAIHGPHQYISTLSHTAIVLAAPKHGSRQSRLHFVGQGSFCSG